LLYEPEIVTVCEVTTIEVFTGKVALVAPAGTVTLAGTVAAELLLESVTCAPPLGAGPFSVTVPVEGPSGPPTTLEGFRASEETTGGVTVSEAVRVPLPDAVIVTWVDAATALVVTGKVALVDPAGTVILAGTVATAGLLLERETTAPPLGAGPLSVTVPVEGFPPVTLVGLIVREDKVRGPVAVLKTTSIQ
jgi:hypothetical protein